MRRVFRYSLSVLLLSFPLTPSYASPASVESIEELFQVTRSKELLAQQREMAKNNFSATVQQMFATVQLPPDQMFTIKKMTNEIIVKAKDKINEILLWENLYPKYIKIYQKTFSEEEIQGMLSFYQSPSGQAVLNKMPQLMSEINTMTQQMLLPMIQTLLKEVQEAAIKAKQTPSSP